MFITIEGGEGVGKTTQIKAVRKWLEERGHDVVATREPGGTPLAEAIRDLVVSVDQAAVPPLAELLLMFAARVSHVDAVIAPALAAGKTVLCDRFIDASYAYQGGGRGLPAGQIETLERWLPDSARPDLTILIDAPIELGLERARRRGDSDRFEQEALDFFRRVREVYLARA
ncbi:MAG TPA: dTMP kinase, partial [Gammaproteobacteria bacterium]|nr:dTMP kinase [Gammaproteobacteria bacterium]